MTENVANTTYPLTYFFKSKYEYPLYQIYLTIRRTDKSIYLDKYGKLTSSESS